MRRSGAEPFYYMAPAILCYNCLTPIELPWSPLPLTDSTATALVRGEDPPALPEDTWSATFGCMTCGFVVEYRGYDVSHVAIPKSAEGKYQSGKGVYFLEFQCGNTRCKAPVSLHVDIGTRSTEQAIDQLRSGTIPLAMPCGHPIRDQAAPKEFYNLSPVLKRMW